MLFVLKFILLLPYSLYRTGALANKVYNLIINCHIKYNNEVLPGYLKYIEETNNRKLKQLSEKDLVDEIERLIRSWACITSRDHILSEICFETSCMLLKSIVGEKKTSILLSGIDGNKLLETNFQLWVLADQASPEVADIIIENEPLKLLKYISKKHGISLEADASASFVEVERDFKNRGYLYCLIFDRSCIQLDRKNSRN